MPLIQLDAISLLRDFSHLSYKKSCVEGSSKLIEILSFIALSIWREFLIYKFLVDHFYCFFVINLLLFSDERVG